MGRDFIRARIGRINEKGLNWKRVGLEDILGRKTLLWQWWGTGTTHRSCGCLIPGIVQGKAGWDSEKLGLVEDTPAHGSGAGTRWSVSSLPTQTFMILWLHKRKREKQSFLLWIFLAFYGPRFLISMIAEYGTFFRHL